MSGTGYNSFANNYASYTRGFNWVEPRNYGSPDQETIDAIYRAKQQRMQPLEIDNERTTLDRTFDALNVGTHISAGFTRGMIRDDLGVFEGMWQGLKASNPFGEGYEKGEHTYSKALGDLGWNPESTAGKFAKGTLGFVLDVGLDPLTYLSGGTSAIVKGTGKTRGVLEAIKEITEKNAYKSFDLKVDELTKKGVDQSLAEQLAKKEFDDTIANTQVGSHMTDEMAETIIKFRNLERGVEETTENVAKQATDLANKYNRLSGIRNLTDTGIKDLDKSPVTWGVGNLPFMPKKHQDKVIKLGDGDMLRKIGDKSGLASAYSKLRSGIYGSQIGRLFSTTSTPYRLAKEDPEKLFDFMQMVEITRGLNVKKLQQDKKIRDYAKTMLNLSPSESKEVMDLLQDKTIWGKVKDKIKLNETSKFKEIKNAMEARKAEANIQFDELQKEREHYENLKWANDQNVISNTDVLDGIRSKYRQDLANINAKEIDDVEKLDALVKSYQDEIAQIDYEIKNSFPPPQKEESLQDIYKRHLSDVEAFKNHRQTKSSVELNQEQFKATEQIEKMGTAPSRKSTYDLIDALSVHIYGERGRLNYSMGDNTLDLIMKEVDTGAKPGDIEYFIESNPKLFLPHAREIHKFIAKELGYDSWHKDGFKEPLAKLLGVEDVEKVTTSDLQDMVGKRMEEGYEWTAEEMQELTSLLNLDMQRRLMQQQYFKMTEDEFTTFRTQLANAELEKEVSDLLEQDDLFKWRKSFNDDDYAGTNRKGNNLDNTPYHTLLTGKEKTGIVHDMIDAGLFSRKAVADAGENNTGFLRHIEMVRDEVEGLLTTYFKREYSDLTPAQRKLAFKMASDKVVKTASGKDRELALRTQIEATKRANQARINTIEHELSVNHKVTAKTNDGWYAGDVVRIDRDESIPVYTIRTPDGTEVSGIRASQIKKIKVNKKSLTADDLIMRNEIIANHIKEKEKVVQKLNDLLAEKKRIGQDFSRLKSDTVKTYETRIKEQQTIIRDLEKNSQEFKRLIDEASDSELDKLAKEIENLEETLASDEAMEIWIRTHAQVDVELMKDPNRHTRGVTVTDDLPDNWFASAGEGGIKIRPDIDKRAFFSAIKNRIEELHGDNYTWEDAKSIINQPEKMKQFLLEHEISHIKNKDHLKNNRKGDRTDPLTREIEARADSEAFEMLRPFDVDEILRNSQPTDAGRIVLENIASSEKIEKLVRSLRQTFDDVAYKEIEIGHMTNEQFAEMMGKYVPHILTPDGKQYLNSLKEIQEHGSSVTHDLGYGNAFNPYRKSRSIKGKNIEEINDYFRDKLKGKNLFSENIADVYVARMLTHNKLSYDDEYMRTMMNTFGREIDEVGTIDKGYKGVINYGVLRHNITDVARMKLSMHISGEVSDHIRSKINSLKELAKASNRNLDDVIELEIERFIKMTFDEDKRARLFDEFATLFKESSGLPKGILDDGAMPMIELKSDQIVKYRQHYNDTIESYNGHIRNQLVNSLLRKKHQDQEINDTLGRIARLKQNRDKMTYDLYNQSFNSYADSLVKRLREIGSEEPSIKRNLNKFEQFEKQVRSDIRQVNDAIVMKANQARRLQVAKDHSKLLKMYDKFLHFMKLNQTTVMPAFHIRNKMSNIFNNWMGIGRDALNLEWQKNATKVAMHKGDIEKLKDMKPINIPNPHPSVRELTNSGQMHWNELYELAKDYDVIDEGFFAQDLGAGAMSRGLLARNPKLNVKAKYDPTDTENFLLYDKGAQIGMVVENGDRLIHFASMLRQGKSIDEASRSSREFLFDYSDLTAFEQSWMKRIFPYYTWMRKNSRLQVAQLIENPEKYRLVAKMQNGVEGMNNEEDQINDAFVSDFAKDWVQTPFTTTNSKGITEPILWNPNLPFMDIGRIPDPTQPLNSTRELLAQTSPQLKLPFVEFPANKNLFFDSEIAKEGDNLPLAYAGHAMSQFALANAVDGAIGKEGVDKALHIGNIFTGQKMLSYDYETYKAMKIQEMLEKESE